MPVVISGMREINRVYEHFKLSSANRIVKPALVKAAQHAAKIVKQSIPGRYKDIRKSIGYRAIKTSKAAGRDRVGAKVGAAVGKRASKVSARERAGRRGVGIAARNIHWWFLGTQERHTKATIKSGGAIKYTGRMPPQSRPINDILVPRSKELMTIIRTHVGIGIGKELRRVIRKI